jgi:RNA polymerase sigma factor (sigma-70 family)
MSDYAPLVMQAQMGDAQQRQSAFNELVALFQKMAFYQAYRTLGDVHTAEDVVQEAFLSAYLHLHQLTEPLGFPGWLRRIVMTHTDRYTRRKTVEWGVLDDENMFLSDEDIEQEYELHDLQERVLAAVRALPDHERAVTEGFYLQGESTKELAERLQIPLPTVKKRLQYAREHLRAIVGGLNAAMDQAIAEILPPAAPPLQKQPIYLYTPRDEHGNL